MPEREHTQVTLGDGQINFNGMTLDGNGVTFTQDGIEAARISTEPVVRRNDDAEITATVSQEEYEAVVDRLYNLVIDIPNRNGLTYTADEFNGYTTTEYSTNTYSAHTYNLDWTWLTYNPYMDTESTPDVAETELNEKNEKLDGFLKEFVKEVV